MGTGGQGMDFTGKVALVTGAGSGIGEATAHRLARDGATVVVLDRLADRAGSVSEAIRAAGGTALPLVADVCDPAQMRLAFARLDGAAGRLDLIVANAGINGHWGPIDVLTPEEWDQTVRANLTGSYLTLHHGVPMLKRSGGGAVVIVSSVNGTRVASTPGATAYAAAKAGQTAMARQLALELAHHRIRVNAVLPGWVKTRIDENTWKHRADEAAPWLQGPDGAVATARVQYPASPESIAGAIVMLLSDDARHISGDSLVVDGGQSLLS